MPKYDRMARAYAFLRECALYGGSFKLRHVVEASGWLEATAATYVSKQWRDVLIIEGTGHYRVKPEFTRLNFDDFKALMTQKRSVSLPPKYDYDVALSFAGEDRAYVQRVADILHSYDVGVFYDRYEQADLWGKDLYSHLDDVYRNKSRYCILFISDAYKAKVWTNHERASAQARALESAGEYLLPARFDNTELPGLRSTTGYINLSSMAPEDFAILVLEKIGRRDELREMIAYMSECMPRYEIYAKGPVLCFQAKDIFLFGGKELVYGEFPMRLMLEMYRADAFEDMFILPSILPDD
jgi:hypothetical protein